MSWTLTANVFISYLLLVQPTQVLGGGHVQIQFLEYANKPSTRLDGGCCDYEDMSSCVDDCENYFDICYRAYNLSKHSPCDQRKVTSHEFDDSEAFSTGPNALGNGVPNPFMFRFEQEWLGSFVLQVTVYDEDSAMLDADPDLVALMRMENHNALISNISVVSSLVSGTAKLKLQWRVVCDEHQYGDCSVYCKPQNSDTTGHYTCDKDGNKVCQPGWTGDICTIDATVCTSRPCLNGGVCNVTAAGFKCTCSPGLVGSVCEHDVSSCGRYPCRNGGTCRNVPNDYVCVCADGFTGKQCEEDINDCESSPCISGLCIDKVASYSCVCGTGYTGVDCHEVVSPTSRKNGSLESLDEGANVGVYAGAGAGAVLLIVIITVIVVLVHRRRRMSLNLEDSDTAVVKMSESDHGGDRKVLDGREPFYATVNDFEKPFDRLTSENPLYGETSVSNVGTMEVNSGYIHNGQRGIQDRDGYICMSGNKGITGIYDKPKAVQSHVQ